MNNTFNQYRHELDSLRFTDEALLRMTARLEGASRNAGSNAAETTATTTTTPADILQTPHASTPTIRRPGMRTKRPARRLLRIAASVAIAAGLGLGATGAYAAATQRSLTAVFSDIFGGSPAQTEVIDKIGHPVGASAACNGITVTADAVIGSSSSCTMVFSISHDDGEPFRGLNPAADGTYPLLWEGHNIQIDGMQGMSSGAYFYDADSSDASIQYVLTISNVTTRDGNGIAGRTARVHLSNLSLASEREEDTSVIAEGSWDLKFQLDYEDSSVALQAGQQFELDGSEATVNKLSVSPVGASVTYTVDDTNTEPTPENLNTGTLPTDKYIHLPFIVTFKDGRTQNGTDADASTSERGDSTVVTKSFIFDAITDLDDIVSITVGNQVVSVR